MNLKIEYMNTNALIPYERNAKNHPDQQIEYIANSIERFGFKQPIVIDRNGVVIVGHGRLLAAKKLGIKTVPVVRAEDLSDEEVKAFRLADNKVAESDWDLELMELELDDIEDIDMTEFGFEDEEEETYEREQDDRDPSLQHNVFENQDRMQFPCVGFYGIPVMKATDTVGDKMLRFMDWKECPNPEEYIAHFYYDDYKFISAWREPDKYIERLSRFKAVVSPDFSLYTDFPRALQILSCYRRQWCGAYWQSMGIDVIPDVVWGDKESFKYCFDGIPKGGTVAVSSVGVKNDEDWNNKKGDMFKAGYDEMLKRLKPSTIYFADDYNHSVNVYGNGNPKASSVIRAKIIGTSQKYSTAKTNYMNALRRGDKLAKACSKAGYDSASNLFALAKGVDVLVDSGGYSMVLNRRGIAMSKSIKAPVYGYGGSW